MEASSFKLEEDVVKGLTKVMPLTGFSGWFKSKTVLAAHVETY